MVDIQNNLYLPMDLSNQIYLPNFSFKAIIKISLQFQTHSEWVLGKVSLWVEEGEKGVKRDVS